MVKVKLLATLKERVGKETLDINAENLVDLLKELSKHVPDIVDPSGRPSPLYLYLINGVDSRVAGNNPKLEKRDEITIVPINHGG